jgi:hypothetical protein
MRERGRGDDGGWRRFRCSSSGKKKEDDHVCDRDSVRAYLPFSSGVRELERVRESKGFFFKALWKSLLFFLCSMTAAVSRSSFPL